MNLEDLLKVTCCSVNVVPHCNSKNAIFIHSSAMENSLDVICNIAKGIVQYLDYEVLALSTNNNGVESVLTIRI